jgi:integrase
VAVTLAGSGLRIGELLGLDVRHVDFLRKTIRVERQTYSHMWPGDEDRTRDIMDAALSPARGPYAD